MSICSFLPTTGCRQFYPSHLAAVSLLAGLLAIGVQAKSAAAASRHNIVLMMADDIGIEGFGCYGGTSYKTPNLDRLATEGMRFTHAYSQPLCTPTRVQLMTGKYNHRNWVAFGILDKQERHSGIYCVRPDTAPVSQGNGNFSHTIHLTIRMLIDVVGPG